jgi:hypothetical protein
MLENMEIDDNFIGLISCDEIKEILDKKDEALEIAEKGMHLIELSNKISNKINTENYTNGINEDFDCIGSFNRLKSLDKQSMMCALEKRLEQKDMAIFSRKVWNI